MGAASKTCSARMKVFLEDEWEINHATLEPEVKGCGNGDLLGRWDQ